MLAASLEKSKDTRMAGRSARSGAVIGGRGSLGVTGTKRSVWSLPSGTNAKS